MTLRAEEIIAAARAKAGIIAFDNESFCEGLDLLLEDVTASDSLTGSGRTGLTKIFVNLLVNRLRVSDWLRRHPELLDTPVARPLFVIGAPRSGTTLANHLLGTDPARRSLMRWEIRNPVPPPERGMLKTDPRCLAMKAAEAARPASQSGSRHLHHEEADTPSECTFLHGQDFKSQYLEALLPTPRYSAWILNCDMRSTYSYQKRVLQVLQSRTGGVWNLKMPSHALHIDALLAIFPDSRIVWTHRDPFTALGSLCSTIEATQRAFNGDVDRAYIGGVYSRQWAEHLLRPLAARARSGGATFIDLDYDALIADPIGQMRHLYAALGDAFTVETEGRMREWLSANPQGRFGAHRYQLSDYGLDIAKTAPLIAPYLAAYPQMAPHNA